MRHLVDVVSMRKTLPKQLEVVAFNRAQYEKRIDSDCPYPELTDWRGRLWRSESEADRLDTLIREYEWGERVPPHP